MPSSVLQRCLFATLIAGLAILANAERATGRYNPPRHQLQPQRPSYNQPAYYPNSKPAYVRPRPKSVPALPARLPKAPGNPPPRKHNPPPTDAPSEGLLVNPKRPNPEKLKPVASEFKRFPRIVAEFEPQRAIMFSVCDLQPHHSHVLKQIVEKSAGHEDILILYNDDHQLKDSVKLLANAGSGGRGSPNHVSFYKLQLDTVWLRDFGPRIAEDDGGTRSLDFFYYGVRPHDDSFPERWALNTSSKLTKIPWTLQGGNLICNGRGLGITTKRVFEDNRISFGNVNRSQGANYDGQLLVSNELKKLCNLKELVFLEPLRGESTKHVDMFAAFLAPDLVLVAKVDPGLDNLNARVLDWNAKKLASLNVDGKRMRVERVNIPPRQGESWSTYTNAIITDRLVLMPVMKTDQPSMKSQAVAKYRQLLPDHHVAMVDITSMRKLQGSLHCLSLNLPAFAPIPAGTIAFDQAREIAAQTPDKKPTVSNVAAPTPFPMDKQLRRIFQSASGDYLVDAYAVSLIGDVVSLLRVNDRKLVRVRITSVCETDRYWLKRNARKIRNHGAAVHRLVMTRQAN